MIFSCNTTHLVMEAQDPQLNCPVKEKLKRFLTKKSIKGLKTLIRAQCYNAPFPLGSWIERISLSAKCLISWKRHFIFNIGIVYKRGGGGWGLNSWGPCLMLIHQRVWLNLTSSSEYTQMHHMFVSGIKRLIAGGWPLFTLWVAWSASSIIFPFF